MALPSSSLPGSGTIQANDVGKGLHAVVYRGYGHLIDGATAIDIDLGPLADLPVMGKDQAAYVSCRGVAIGLAGLVDALRPSSIVSA